MKHLLLLAVAFSEITLGQTWTMLTSTNPSLPTVGLPGVAVVPIVPALNDGDSQSLRMQLDPNASFGGIWLRVGSGFQPVARRLSSGALGPNRQGAEAQHQFLALNQFEDSGPGPGTAFLASAGDPAGGDTSIGVWRWLNGQNRELARYETDGPLGPGLGAQWRFVETNASFMAINAGPNGVALAQSVLSPTQAARSALVLLAENGNTPCMLQGETSTALGPNLGDGSSFNFGTYTTARHGERYFVNATASREGIWQVCAGPPRPIAVTQAGGSLGPNLGSLESRFTTIRTLPKPHAHGAAIFLASFVFDSASSNRGGLFRHQGGLNHLLVQTSDTSAALGPNYLGSRFEFIDPVNSQFDSADTFVALETSVLTPQNQRIHGLWRMRADGDAEPVALEGVTGPYSPGQGQVFTGIHRWKLFANGDIVAECQIGAMNELYLFRIGRAPRPILRNLQLVPLVTPTATLTVSVDSFSLLGGAEGAGGGAADSGNGVDAWSANDGGIVVSAFVSSSLGNAQVLMRTVVSDVTKLFGDGFEAQ